ncbi:22823_t:CDS:2 [Racocetra persica]|uniref:22823_t:CDS:1 n=1 Tax=Racocetra persica TaxID=160502 RepID=A0ACA9NYI2_9GLOM|nr:22823_t:CDS:2 [Racocetra persica]
MNENKDLVTSLLPIKLCESNGPSASNNISYTIDFRHLSHFCVSNIFTPILQKSLNCDDEFFNIMEEFISTKIHELQLLEENKVDNKVESQPAIVNLFMTKYCGRPSKRFKSTLEQTANS